MGASKKRYNQTLGLVIHCGLDGTGQAVADGGIAVKKLLKAVGGIFVIIEFPCLYRKGHIISRLHMPEMIFPPYGKDAFPGLIFPRPAFTVIEVWFPTSTRVSEILFPLA